MPRRRALLRVRRMPRLGQRRRGEARRRAAPRRPEPFVGSAACRRIALRCLTMSDTSIPNSDTARAALATRAALAAADGPPALRFPYDATALTEHPLRTDRLVLRPIE